MIKMIQTNFLDSLNQVVIVTVRKCGTQFLFIKSDIFNVLNKELEKLLSKQHWNLIRVTKNISIH